MAYSNNLSDFDLNDNHLIRPHPRHSRPGRIETNLININLNDNQLSGTIPGHSIGYLPRLGHLELYDNRQLTGTLPDSLGTDVNLLGLDVHNNNLSGTINANLSALILDLFNISGNRYNFSVLPVQTGFVASFTYAPQQNIPLTRVEANLSVSAGGNPALSTYTLFKNGASIATQTGELQLLHHSVWVTTTSSPPIPAPAANHFIPMHSLKLGLVLPDSTVTSTQSILPDTVTNLESNIFLIASLTPTPGTNALSGNVTALETVDSSIQTYNGAPYVQRHYDITPATNASTAQATITLYFSQADFDAYNAFVTANGTGVPRLPSGGVDNGNVIITQYHLQALSPERPVRPITIRVHK